MEMQRLKEGVKWLDDVLFGGLLKVAFERSLGRKAARLRFVQKRELEAASEFKIEIIYKKNHACEFANLCDFYGTDKGELRPGHNPYPWASHTYSDFYSGLFSHCRGGVSAVFECGIGTTDTNNPSTMGQEGVPGASLRVWRDYFPNANVFGADIDTTVLFQEDRISTFCVDQLDPKSIADLWKKVSVPSFDLMIDDGLHTFEGGSTLFLYSIHKLTPHGVYIIEDVYPSDLLLYKEFFNDMNYHVEFVVLNRPNVPLWNNNLVVVRNPQNSNWIKNVTD